MRILVDTDVLIDTALGRHPHSVSSGRLLDYLERRPGVGHVAWHTIANFYYLVSTARSDRKPRSFIDSLCSFVRVAQTPTESLQYALSLDMKDFEDAMQVAAASACGADIIATRNLKDYTDSPVRAASPRELLEEIGVT